MNRNDDSLSPEIRFHLIRRMERLKVIALGGTELLAHEAKYLGFHRVAGVILFERNVQSLAQVGDLIGSVEEALGDGESPPLVMADHEGDFVAELRNIIGVPPAPLALAATGDTDLAYQVALETGRAMRKLGVNTVLAPVADCFFDRSSPITGLRTFGTDPQRVAEFVVRTIEGFRDAGVVTCAKHFPGHGSTDEDSHETLPEVTRSREELEAADLVPFRHAVQEGVDMIMMSHVAYPMGGEDLVPASFDGGVIRDMLRRDLGYDGVVITDALEMAGARWYTSTRFAGLAGGSEHALLAGCDLMLHGRPVPERVQMEGTGDPVMSVDVIETIMKTLERVVDRARIDEKLAEAAEENEALGSILDTLSAASARVARLRERLEPPGERARPAGAKVIAFDAYPSVPQVYTTAAQRAIVTLSDWTNFQPLEPAGGALILPVEWHATGSLHRQGIDEWIDVLCKRFPHWRRTAAVHEFVAGPDGSMVPLVPGGAGGGVVDAARFTGSAGGPQGGGVELYGDEALILLLSARGVPPEDFMAALTEFCDAAAPSVAIITGWPVFDWVSEETPALWTIGASPQVAAAVTHILTGELDPIALPPGLVPGPS